VEQAPSFSSTGGSSMAPAWNATLQRALNVPAARGSTACAAGTFARLPQRLTDIGVADEDDRFALRVDDALGRGGVTFERQRRVLDELTL
jgi:hypothetical protein